MKADYIQHCGDDLTVVNAARVSFDKESEWDTTAFTEGDLAIAHLSERDQKLIGFLSRNGHWTPFSHCMVTFRMTAPIFVARQAFKHKVGFTENEISRRYVDDTPEFYMPKTWRGKPENAKQGSSDVIITTMDNYCHVGIGVHVDGQNISEAVQELYTRSQHLYECMIENGVAPEQARMVLPQAMYTSWYWTASLAAWARFYKLRTDSHAQSEIQELAGMIGPTMADLFPCSWKALTDAPPTQT